MLAHHFVLIVLIWGVLNLIPMFTFAYFGIQVMNHRKPSQRPIWDMRSNLFASDPANLTETGLVYRDKAIKAQLAFGAWLLVSMIVFHFL